MLQISLFGAPKLVLDGEPLMPPLTGKPLAVLIYLIVTRHVYSRDALADLFWSDLSSQAARNNLRYLLPDLRRVVGDYLRITPHSVAFTDIHPWWCDVAVVRQTLAAPPETVATADLQAALDLYHGEFLVGFRVRNAPNFEEWVSRQQTELHGLVVHGLTRLAGLYLQAGDFVAGFATTNRLLALAPWHEEGYQLHLQLLASTGQRSQALEQYQQLTARLQEELGVAPSAETTALFDAIRNGHLSPHAPPVGHSAQTPVASLPPPLTPSALARTHLPAHEQLTALQAPTLFAPRSRPPQHNLPLQLMPLIGRQQEIAAVLSRLLNPAHRLISVVGAGGAGKTRFALAVAEAAQPHFVDGVWFVGLAALTANVDLHQQIAAAIGEALDLSFAGPAPLATQLFAQLRHKQLLLVLDNFEQLLVSTPPAEAGTTALSAAATHCTVAAEAADGATFLVHLLQALPGVKLIVTSRHHLELQIELPWPLDGLNFPSLDMAATLSERQLLGYESIALFVERASRARPNFQFDTENRTAIIQICQLVEGAPLAIELAASQVRTQSSAAIAGALHHSYQVLTTTLRDLPLAHRTMQSVLHSSWALLTADEQRLLARMAVFRGGCTAAAAAAVTGAHPAHLTSLIHHSLLQVARDGAGQERYLMHELVRQYGAEQLARSASEESLMRAQHCTFYTELLASEREGLTRYALARHRVQADLDNIRAAWDWGVAHHNYTALAQSLDPLTAFYEFVGFFGEAARAFENASAQLQALLAQESTDSGELAFLLGRLWAERVGFLIHLGRPTEAIEHARLVIELGERTGNRYLLADGQRRLGGASLAIDDYHLARTVLEAGLAIAREVDDARLIALCLHNLAMISYNQGDYDHAIACNQEALVLAQACQDRIVEAPLSLNLGSSYLVQGNFAPALAYLTQNLEVSRQLEWRRLFAYAGMNMGYLLTYLGEYRQAQAYLEEALALFRTLNGRAEEINTLCQLGQVYREQGELTRAYQTALQVLQITEAEEFVWQRGISLIELGDTLMALGRASETLPIYTAAVDLWEKLENDSQVSLAQAALAAAHLALQQHAAARTLVEKVLPTLAAATVEGARLFWVCYQVLAAEDDARHIAVLQQGYQFLQRQLQTITDGTLRHSFQARVAINRALLDAAKAHGISHGQRDVRS